MNSSKRLGLLVWVSLLISSSVLAQASPTLSIEQIVKSASSETMATTILAGTQYAIPQRYLGYPVKSNKEEGIFIVAEWPEMTPRTREEDNIRGWNKKIQMIAYDASQTSSFDYRNGIARERIGEMTEIGKISDLYAYRGTNGVRRHLIQPSHPVYKDKKTVVNPTPAELLTRNAIYLTDSKDGNSTMYILCVGDGESMAPSCQQWFNNGEILYHVTYGKDNLAQWKEIKEKSIALIKSFQVK